MFLSFLPKRSFYTNCSKWLKDYSLSPRGREKKRGFQLQLSKWWRKEKRFQVLTKNPEALHWRHCSSIGHVQFDTNHQCTVVCNTGARNARVQLQTWTNSYWPLLDRLCPSICPLICRSFGLSVGWSLLKAFCKHLLFHGYFQHCHWCSLPFGRVWQLPCIWLRFVGDIMRIKIGES